jgi:endoglucanase
MRRANFWSGFAPAVVALLCFSCGGSPDSEVGPGPGSESGGAPGSGGAGATGGSPGSGGLSGSGGGAPSGGTTGAGGSGETGGSGGSPDLPGSGGDSNSGGAPSTGGVPGAGGTVPSGDAPTAVEAAEQMGRGVNLGQMFESTQHPRTLQTAAAKIDAYYARGFRNIRIPVTWTEAIGGDTLVTDPNVGAVNRDNPRLAVIESVIDHALSKPGLFVVLNAHHEHALKTQARSAVLEKLWEDIADIFGDKDHRLLFEILNEPHKDDSTAMAAADLRLMTGLAYDKIRATDSERIVIIGGNQWFGAQEVPQVWTDLEPVGGGTDPYVMATFHHYNPWTFCGNEQGDYADAWTENDLSSPMETMRTWAQGVGQGMPVYIGEWGVGWGSRYESMTCNNIREWYTKFDSEFAAPRGQPTAVWDDGGWFQIWNHASNSFGNNLIDCIEGECTWDGSERMNAGCS